MKFEPKISGVAVTDFNIKPIFNSQIISLQEVNDADLPQVAMDWILDTIRFSKGQVGWWCTLDYDSIYKLSIYRDYPQYKEELDEQFGEDNWLNRYLRFNH